MKSNKVFIIAEAGVNHNGSIEIAKKLIDVATSSGADAVKFQTFKAVNVVSKNAPKAEYQNITTSPSESQFDMIQKLELDANTHKELITYCLKKGIEAKIHYPIPIYRQEALRKINSKKLNFPVTEMHAKKLISFPCDQHLSKKQMDYIIVTVRKFYARKN